MTNVIDERIIENESNKKKLAQIKKIMNLIIERIKSTKSEGYNQRICAGDIADLVQKSTKDVTRLEGNGIVIPYSYNKLRDYNWESFARAVVCLRLADEGYDIYDLREESLDINFLARHIGFIADLAMTLGITLEESEVEVNYASEG
jgi:hypothetical protein